MTTREQIIAAAKDAGFKAGYLGSHYSSTEALERFYTIIANQTKDRCAALCYEQNWKLHGSEMAALIEATKEEELSNTEKTTEADALLALYRFLRHPVQAGPVWVKYKRQGVDGALTVVEDLMKLHGFEFKPAKDPE